MELLYSPRQLIRLVFSINQLLDSGVRADQKCAVIAFGKIIDRVLIAGQRIEFLWSRFPAPQPVLHARPESALAVRKQSSHAVAKSAVLAVAADAAIVNRAELTNGSPKPSSPYGAFMIFQQRDNYLSSKLRVLSQLAVLPTGKPVPG